jgi:hypothetical protein
MPCCSVKLILGFTGGESDHLFQDSDGLEFSMRFGFLTEVQMLFVVFCLVMSFGLAGGYQRVGGTYSSYSG